jgi:hypothetical protein
LLTLLEAHHIFQVSRLRVKLSRTYEIVVNVNKMKKCFRQTASRPTTEQRSTFNRAEDKSETLETYGAIYTRPDSQTIHSDATEKDMTENLTQDSNCETYHHSHPRTSSCGNAEVQVDGIATPKYPMGNQTGEYRRDVGDRTQGREGEGGSISETLCTEVKKVPTPNELLEV